MWGYMVKLTKSQLILASKVWREPRSLLELGFLSDHTRTYQHSIGRDILEVSSRLMLDCVYAWVTTKTLGK